MASNRCRIVVIGGGHAAGRLVERLRHHGHEGEIVLIGEEAHLPYERPFLSKAMLTDVEEPSPPGLLDAGPAVTHRSGSPAVAIDRAARRVELADGTREAYDVLVLATGLAPRRLPALSALGDRVCCLHTLDDARALRARMRRGGSLALVGAGFIGLEVASSARAVGLDVDVVEAAPLPLMRALPPRLGARLASLHRAEGSRLHLGAGIARVEPEGDGVRITLNDGRAIDAGTVVLGIGGTPRVELAVAAGLETADGILVDVAGRTSDPAIYAIGDVARRRGDDGESPGLRLESWRNAEDSAAAAAASIMAVDAPAPSGPPSFWTDQLGRRIQFLGMPDPLATLWETGEPFAPGYGAFLLRDGTLRQALFVSAPRVMRAARDAFRKGGAIDAETLRDLGFVETATEAGELESA